MSRTRRGFQKVTGEYRRMRRGYVKQPDRLRAVSVRKLPLRQKNADKIENPRSREQPETRLGVKAHQTPKEQGRAVSASTPAPEIAKPATRHGRRAWGGKYDALAPQDPP